MGFDQDELEFSDLSTYLELRTTIGLLNYSFYFFFFYFSYVLFLK